MTDKPESNGRVFGETLKYTALIAIVGIAFVLLREKLKHIPLEHFWEGLNSIPRHKVAIAIALTCINYFVLTGYDWIAVRCLKKDLPLRRIMTGAIVGYSLSNVFGWMFGGTAVRYRLYSNWGFALSEIVALLSILSVTFWLGMFLLAGITFVTLPVNIPAEFREKLILEPHVWGWIFLGAVVMYLLASAFIRRPVHWGNKQFTLPPIHLSVMQLVVSAIDFLIASAVLWVLLPEDQIAFSVVLVSYMAGMIAVVIVHAPGGIGVLDLIILHLLTGEHAPTSDSHPEVAVTCGLLLYRVIYYLIPGAVGGLLYLWNEFLFRRRRRLSRTQRGSDDLIQPS
jgi:uncharacterized membrane protein YbhN (UPF0104 family)